MLARTLRLLRTVRYLRLIQVTGRLAAKVRRLRIDYSPSPAVRAVQSGWVLPAWRAPSMRSPHEFCFLNEAHTLIDAADWNRADWPRLWVYNLHYFDDLDAIGADRRVVWHRALVQQWIAQNPAPTGAGWEPYCLSLRIVNWCRWAWRGESLSQEATQSLAVQVRALADQIEVHLLGNHLFANAKALVVAGMFFEGPEADRWFAIGMRHLQAELTEQILADGGHFERSPMYHSIIAGDVLDLLAADRVAPGRLEAAFVARLGKVATAMLSWMSDMSHEDGRPSFFNDCALGIAPTSADLNRMATALDIPVRTSDAMLRQLEPSGYVRARRGRALLIADAGPVGPDYLPGHAHADTLSFELSIGVQRVLVNSGTSEYVGSRRLRERGTAAHNTVVVDGADSSEVWSSFRVARRARPFAVAASSTAEQIHVSASHDGYRRLGRGTDHRRTWILSDGALTIEDVLTGRPLVAEAWFHLHPDISVHVDEDGCRLECRGKTMIRAAFEGGAVDVVEGHWAPEFGLLWPNQALRVRFSGTQLVSRWRWH